MIAIVLGVAIAALVTPGTAHASAGPYYATGEYPPVTLGLDAGENMTADGEITVWEDGAREWYTANERTGVLRVYASDGVLVRTGTYTPGSIKALVQQVGTYAGRGSVSPSPNDGWTTAQSDLGESAVTDAARAGTAEGAVERKGVWGVARSLFGEGLLGTAARASAWGLGAYTLYQIGSLIFHKHNPSAGPGETGSGPYPWHSGIVGYCVVLIGESACPSQLGSTDPGPPVSQVEVWAVYNNSAANFTNVDVDAQRVYYYDGCRQLQPASGGPAAAFSFQGAAIYQYWQYIGCGPNGSPWNPIMHGRYAAPFADLLTDSPHPPAAGEPSSAETVQVSPPSLPSQATLDTGVENALPKVGTEHVVDTWIRAVGSLPGATIPVQPPVAPGSIAVPDCAGMVWSSCASAIAAAGLDAVRNDLGFYGADLTQPAAAVISTAPIAGNYVQSGATVTVTTNPDTMPVVVPAPNTGETYDAYIVRLQDLGLVGQVVTLTDAESSPQYGANAVVRTSPAPGTRVVNGTTVKVYANPDDGTTGGGGAGPIGPTLPGFHAPSIATPCNVFPFGVPCWVVNQVSALAVSPQAPSWTVHNSLGNLHVDLGNVAGHDLGDVMAIVRPILLLLSLVGLVYWLAGFALGGSTGGGGSEDE